MFENMNFINYSQLSSKCVTSVLCMPSRNFERFFRKAFWRSDRVPHNEGPSDQEIQVRGYIA